MHNTVIPHDKLWVLASALNTNAMYGKCEPDINALAVPSKQGDANLSSDEENYLTAEEIRAFVESNKSFYSQRERYRQHLRDSFTDYCRATQPSKPLRAESG